MKAPIVASIRNGGWAFCTQLCSARRWLGARAAQGALRRAACRCRAVVRVPELRARLRPRPVSWWRATSARPRLLRAQQTAHRAQYVSNNASHASKNSRHWCACLRAVQLAAKSGWYKGTRYQSSTAHVVMARAHLRNLWPRRIITGLGLILILALIVGRFVRAVIGVVFTRSYSVQSGHAIRPAARPMPATRAVRRSPRTAC